MYAVIKTGGKQYKVAKGDSVFVEKLEVKVVRSNPDESNSASNDTRE